MTLNLDGSLTSDHYELVDGTNLMNLVFFS